MQLGFFQSPKTFWKACRKHNMWTTMQNKNLSFHSLIHLSQSVSVWDYFQQRRFIALFQTEIISFSFIIHSGWTRLTLVTLTFLLAPYQVKFLTFLILFLVYDQIPATLMTFPSARANYVQYTISRRFLPRQFHIVPPYYAVIGLHYCSASDSAAPSGTWWKASHKINPV